jgi:sulfate transport system ATP-binding protein
VTIEVRGVSKTFGGHVALREVSLTVATGELVALLGPSGSGKTTLLRIIAGLERADGGQVHFDGASGTGLHARDRRVGFVFQHYALFRHMTVLQNVSFGLTVRPRATRPAQAEIRARATRLLQLVQLESMADRFPAQLSGGQRQRVALARALAVEPRVLLLDEPFGALDSKVRKELRTWLRRLHDEVKLTSVFVTHDQEEAMEVADRVVVMNHASIEQVGTPEEVYARPATPFVFNFLGEVNLFHGRISGGRIVLESPSGAAAPAPGSSGAGAVYVRPHELEVSRIASADTQLRGRVVHYNAAGPVVKLEVSSSGTANVHVELSQERFRELRLAHGDEVFLAPKQARVFAEDYEI